MSRPSNGQITNQPCFGGSGTTSDSERNRPDKPRQNGIGSDVIVRADTGHQSGWAPRDCVRRPR